PVVPAVVESTEPQGKEYNDAVQIFAIDEAMGATSPAYPASGISVPVRGKMQKRIFFGHASAAIGKKDKSDLRSLARRVKSKTDVAVMVVGHASHRVNRVKDPMKKKLINLAMAQKRADSVTRELRKNGLKPAWVQAVSKGDEEPNPNPGHMQQEAAD